MRRVRVLQTLAVIVVLAAGVAFGWLAGGGEEPVQAASEPVQFTPPTAVNDAAFTPPADIAGTITIKSGEFGGTGSNYVCDRELLISALTAKPDRMQAWARVEAIDATPEAVANYVRGLRPATLLKPTRVTTHTFVNGKAKASQAILADGTAVLIDDNQAIRVRRRTGSPLLTRSWPRAETCESGPPVQRTRRRGTLLDRPPVHPAPPSNSPTAPKGTRQVDRRRGREELPPQYIVKERHADDHGPRSGRAGSPKPISGQDRHGDEDEDEDREGAGKMRTVMVPESAAHHYCPGRQRNITVYRGRRVRLSPLAPPVVALGAAAAAASADDVCRGPATGPEAKRSRCRSGARDPLRPGDQRPRRRGGALLALCELALELQPAGRAPLHRCGSRVRSPSAVGHHRRRAGGRRSRRRRRRRATFDVSGRRSSSRWRAPTRAPARPFRRSASKVSDTELPGGKFGGVRSPAAGTLALEVLGRDSGVGLRNAAVVRRHHQLVAEGRFGDPAWARTSRRPHPAWTCRSGLVNQNDAGYAARSRSAASSRGNTTLNVGHARLSANGVTGWWVVVAYRARRQRRS